MAVSAKRPLRLVCEYAPPRCQPSVWDYPPPADVMIGNGGRVMWGDFSIVFHGSDTGVPFHVRPWRVEWLGAVGTQDGVPTWFALRHFRRYKDAIRYAKNQERRRRQSLRGDRR